MDNIDLKAAVWRGLKGFVTTFVVLVVTAATTAITGLVAVPVDFNDPKKTASTFAVAFAVGFLMALGKLVRDQWGNPNGSGAVNKLTP